jgi:hypothetical protein
MNERFQFTMRNALIAMTLLTIWCAVNALDLRSRNAPQPLPLVIFSLFLKVTLPAGAFGALLGRPWFGLACGAVGAGAYLLWEALVAARFIS